MHTAHITTHTTGLFDPCLDLDKVQDCLVSPALPIIKMRIFARRCAVHFTREPQSEEQNIGKTVSFS